MLARTAASAAVSRLLRTNRVVAVLGPRQCGKTTLARQLVKDAGRPRPVHWFDLEDAAVEARFADPGLLLSPLKGLIVIDEIQRRPELFPLLRILVDRKPLPARFLILGSAAPDLLRQASESLAGRIAYFELGGFDLVETGPSRLDRLWFRGGFPPAFLARSNAASRQWRQDFVRTYLERDLPGLGLRTPAPALRRFWMMLAHYHGQVWNAAELARSLGVNEGTARRYLDLLTGTFMVRQLPPWFQNLGKRQVKAPKIYFRDSGLLHALLGLREPRELQVHPRLGASWEGFALEQVLKIVAPEDAYFWATHAGAELDLLVFQRGKRIGFEFKYADAPALTKSMHTAVADLGLSRLHVIYPGPHRYPLAKRIDAVPLSGIADLTRGR